ncbi:MAG: type II secretion system protein [Patescibacteria group bacterium]
MFLSKQKNKENLATYKSGFTLIELLVSVFIIGVIASVTVYNHKEFTDSLEITNLAYAVALSIREAQISGTAVKGISGNFEKAYGIHFNINPETDANFPGNNKAYLLFVDDENDQYIYGNLPPNYLGFNNNCGDPSINLECIQQIDIGRGNFISKICVNDGSGDLSCSDDSNLAGVDLTFLRPKLDTNIRFRRQNGTVLTPPNQYNDKEAIICLKSPSGRTKSINVLHSGQIYVGKDTICEDISDES